MVGGFKPAGLQEYPMTLRIIATTLLLTLQRMISEEEKKFDVALVI